MGSHDLWTVVTGSFPRDLYHFQALSTWHSFYWWIPFHCTDISHRIYPSTDEPLGCLPIMNFATMKIHVHGFFCRPTFFFPLVRYAEVEWMSHTVMLCLIFWGTAKLFPQVAAPFDTPASKIWGSNLSTVLSMLVTVFFYYRHLNEWAVVPHCGFCLYFPND